MIFVEWTGNPWLKASLIRGLKLVLSLTLHLPPWQNSLVQGRTGWGRAVGTGHPCCVGCRFRESMSRRLPARTLAHTTRAWLAPSAVPSHWRCPKPSTSCREPYSWRRPKLQSLPTFILALQLMSFPIQPLGNVCS